MNDGKKLEATIKNACIEQDVDYTRLKDAGWRGEETTRRFTSKNICDCILFYNRTLLFAEIKHRKKSLRFDEITQLDELGKKWDPLNYIFSGVICQLNGRMFFLSWLKLNQMASEIEKKSFNDKDAEIHGVIIPMVKPKGKRTYRPEISEIIEMLD